jgi:hypothetical protein
MAKKDGYSIQFQRNESLVEEEAFDYNITLSKLKSNSQHVQKLVKDPALFKSLMQILTISN